MGVVRYRYEDKITHITYSHNLTHGCFYVEGKKVDERVIPTPLGVALYPPVKSPLNIGYSGTWHRKNLEGVLYALRLTSGAKNENDVYASYLRSEFKNAPYIALPLKFVFMVDIAKNIT